MRETLSAALTGEPFGAGPRPETPIVVGGLSAAADNNVRPSRLHIPVPASSVLPRNCGRLENPRE